MLQSSPLSYIKPREYLKTESFKFNPFDSCVDNKIIEGETITVVFHVYGVKASHKETNVVDNF